MKFLDTKFEDYLIQYKTRNMHPELKPILSSLPTSLKTSPNVIFYGPAGVGKYTQALAYIKRFSATDLKYERKINCMRSGGKRFLFKISDIHFEIDMQLLGCTARALWNQLFHQVLDIISTRQARKGIILCKNFQDIHPELLSLFCTYMQILDHKSIVLTYVIVTESLSFLSDKIIDRCLVIPVRRPTRLQYAKCIGISLGKAIDPKTVTNVKDLIVGLSSPTNACSKVAETILGHIIDPSQLDFLCLRDSLYDMFIYQQDVCECLWLVISKLVRQYDLTHADLEHILLELYRFLRRFNNNYRPIYHLEHFILYLCTTINRIQT